MKPWQIKTIDRLNELSIQHYKSLCNVFISELGFTQLKTNYNIEESIVTGTGSIELGILAHNFVFLASQNSGINDIDLAIKIRKFADSKTNKGLIISLGKFSRELKSASKRKGELPIDLIDGENLTERLSKMTIEFLIKDGENYNINEEWLSRLIDK